MDRVIEGLFTVIRGLGPKKRQELFKKLFSEGMLSKDQQDIMVIESRRGEPSRPLEEVAERLRSKKSKQ